MSAAEVVLGTVTQVNPPRVRQDAATTDDPAVPCSMVQVVQDARALCLRVGKRLFLVATSSSNTAYVPLQIRGTAAPTGGTWVQGDLCWNSAPASAASIGWVCTVAGTPGTWKAFGTIA